MLKFIYILFFSVCFFSVAVAGEKKYPITDLSELQPEQDTTIVPQDNSSSDDHATIGADDRSAVTDTTLSPNELTIPPDSVVHWKNLKAFEYAKYLDSLLKAKQDKENAQVSNLPRDTGPSWLDSVFASPVTRVFFWTLAGLFIIFILYKLFLTDGVFRKKMKKDQSVTPGITVELITNESDFDAMIGQALRNGNYRLGVRYQYLKTLHQLATRNFIELAADKTNYQYVQETGNRGGFLKNDFAALTLSYEYVWYGEFAIDETTYLKIETGFTNFNRKF